MGIVHWYTHTKKEGLNLNNEYFECIDKKIVTILVPSDVTYIQIL